MLASAADPIMAFGTDRTTVAWNPAAERVFGWTAAEVLGQPPPIIPAELQAEHNAVLERVRDGGQISFATRRIRKDGGVLDLRIDASPLLDGGRLAGWVNVCHTSGGDDAARHYMAERARVVRRLGDVVADMNAQLKLEAVLDRIAASLRELTRADAGGFVLIDGDRLRLVSLDGLPAGLRGRTADLDSSMVGELMRSGKTVMLATADTGGFDDLIWSALPGLHTITLSLSHVAGRPYGALYALYSRRQVGHIELELLELLAGHASVALSNVTAFEEVLQQRAHERAVIDASADGIAVLDESGLVRQWNPAAHRLTGLPAAQAAGQPLPFPVPEPGAKLNCKLANGRWLEVLCTGFDGRAGMVVDFRDVTAAKELEEAKDLFLATTSHELRTPITVVHGFASTLASRWDSLTDADRRSAVQTIADRAGSLGRLVEQLLLGSRAGDGQLPVSNGPFDLAPLLARRGVRVQPAVRPAQPDGRHPGRAARRLRGPDGHRLDRRPAAGERVQVLAGRRAGHGGGQLRRGADRGHRHRPGHRHPRGRHRAGLRAVRAGRRRGPPPVRRHRPGPVHRPPAGPCAGRRGAGQRRAGRRHLHAAAIALRRGLRAGPGHPVTQAARQSSA